jgi:hypothetical protein
MAVGGTHRDYEASATDWARARDVLAGEDAVKAAGAKYLPRLDSQSDEDYSAYKARVSLIDRKLLFLRDVLLSAERLRKNWFFGSRDMMAY